MGSTSDWDDGKKKWSKTKDALLSDYLTVFFQKLYRKNQPILYVDGFAGGGMYGNGDKGSPLIALEVARAAQDQSKAPHIPVTNFVFAEKSKRRVESLRKAIEDDVNAASEHSNTFIENDGYQSIVRRAIGAQPIYGTWFFYVDPFGIVDLDFDLFREISEINGKSKAGVEILLNFSSVGFLREACCVMKVQSKIPPETEDSDEHFDGSTSEREERLSTIFGGDGWHKTLEDLRDGQIDFWKAEDEVSKTFTANLSECFNFVLNMPVKDHARRVDAGGLMKYRMIHMTNHWMGCTEMNDDMARRIGNVDNLQLFPIDVSGNPVGDEDIAKQFASIANDIEVSQEFPMGMLAACVEASIGVTRTTHDLCKIGIAPLLESGTLRRVVELTRTGRRKTSFSPDDLVMRA